MTSLCEEAAEARRDRTFHRWTGAMLECAAATLPGFLQRQRWYPGKDGGAPVVTLSALLPLFASRVPAAVAVWQVTPPKQSPMQLFVSLALVPAREADPAQVITPKHRIPNAAARKFGWWRLFPSTSSLGPG